MMTKDEAIHKALKVLNCLNNDRVYETAWVKGAINACKEALEQRDLYSEIKEGFDALKQPAQEPAYQVGEIVNPYGSNIKIKQPAQEPVAWMYQTEDENFKTDTLSVGYEPTFDGKIIPLYTHPAPSWQGLSDDEIMNIARESYMSRDGGDIKFARAINDKLKEKNYG